MTTEQTTTQTINDKTENFELITYNGFEILIHKETSYFNATKLCHEICLKEGKRVKEFKHLKKSPQFLDAAEYYREKMGPTNFGGPNSHLINPELGGMIEVINGKGFKNEVRGHYCHPELIDAVLTLTSIKYLDLVHQLMNSINDSVHEQLKNENKPDIPENAKPIFEQKVAVVSHVVSDLENQQNWGIREHGDKYDYLDSWDRSAIINLMYKFKQDIIKQVKFSFEQLKQDYPQLFE